MIDIRYEIYTNTSAEAVARMWTESREGWPPGFLGASEFTPESIQLEEDSSGKLYTVLAFENDRVVGYCRTTPYGGESDAAYIALLNVVPDLHGRKLGKNLLLDAVRRTALDGYYRIDLHTWPANLKAMPLYKKTGFFWVPDSMVYMQNYMPFLLGRTEFRDFLGEKDWYECFVRELEVEPDEQKTENGREVFNYLFKIGDSSFNAEFDRRGRILSSIRTPALSASLSREDSRFFFGKPLRVRIDGNILPEELSLDSHAYLSSKPLLSRAEAEEGFDVTPETIEVPIPDRDRSPRLSTVLPGNPEPLEIGIGIKAEEPVSIISNPVRRLAPGQQEMSFDIRNLAESDSFRLEADLGGTVFLNETYRLTDCIFQQIQIPLPELPGGTSELSLRLFQDSFTGPKEKIILVSGPLVGAPLSFLTRKEAVITGKDFSLSVLRRGGLGILRIPGENDTEFTAGYIGISAGPPYWNSDLPHQLYDISVNGDEITAETLWSSRPGLKHELIYRLDPAGFAEVKSNIQNDSASDQKINFAGRWGGGRNFVAETRIIPLKKGILACEEVYNQIPDVSEDYPRHVSDLAAPWLAVSNGKKSLMAWFPFWNKLQHGRPETEEIIVSPGDKKQSPVFRLLLSMGGLKSVLSDARILGWNTGSSLKKINFTDSNIEPLMREGFELILSHNLLGKRSGTIAFNNVPAAEGSISAGKTISAAVPGTDTAEVSLDIAGRESVYPVRIIGAASPPAELAEDDGILSISNGRMRALIDPSEFGHVYSLKLDGIEYLMSSHPGPSDFAWEKPWFGGIHPRITDGSEKPFKLDTIDSSVDEFKNITAGLPEKGWEILWKVDHKKFGSLNLSWRISMLPEVPLLKTRFSVKALHECYSGGELDIRGFLSPGGGHDNAILTAQSKPLLRQGRKHAGAWFDVGQWARLETPGKGFIEAHSLDEGIFLSEDYAESGCHLSVINSCERERKMEIFWIFGNCEDDDALSNIFRKQLARATL